MCVCVRALARSYAYASVYMCTLLHVRVCMLRRVRGGGSKNHGHEGMMVMAVRVLEERQTGGAG